MDSNQQDFQNSFAEVILPVPIGKYFTYRIPISLINDVKPGCRVLVPFGKRKVMTGLIVHLHNNPPLKYEAKTIIDLLDKLPVAEPIQFRFFEWLADYYLCSIGEVMQAAIPSGLKLSSESQIQLHPEFDLESYNSPISENELLILENLSNDRTLTYTEVSEILGKKSIHSVIKSLIQREAIIIFEEVKEKYKPKKQKRIRLKAPYSGDTDELEDLVNSLNNKEKQQAIILRYLQRVPVFKLEELNPRGILKADITKDEDLSTSSLQTLIKNDVFEEFEVIISRFDFTSNQQTEEQTLSEEQQHAFDQILNEFEDKQTVLLHGVTGSGKTAIYSKLMQLAIESDRQVLFMVPEIALTTQIVQRLKKIFGNKLGVYHSRFSDNERVEVWQGVKNKAYNIIVGVRSSIFLPFDNLGLIIVDEEHDSSYKQHDPAPRYQGRDMAHILGRFHNAKVLLGSATPSIESYHHAKIGKYGLVTLLNRYGESQMPDIELVDLREAKKRKQMKGDFSNKLLEKIQEVLSNNEQVIIFQNRRGYAPYIQCETCGHIPKCEHCDISLTYHQYKKEMRCHYCGYTEPLPIECDACGSRKLKTVSYGTEKLEEDLKLFIPEARVGRMDLETTRRKHSYENIINDFDTGEINILVGTQMVTKGLDFDKVGLVGVLDADRMMYFPDLRSYERSFQLLLQVSGRTGRRDKVGKVMIQTSIPEHQILHWVRDHEYENFYFNEIKERHSFIYPPFSRLISLTIKNQDKLEAIQTAEAIAFALKRKYGVKGGILGPQEPMVGKIRNQYLMQLIIKIDRKTTNLGKIKQDLDETIAVTLQDKNFKRSRVVIDVDPY
ncbi:replication restart helicase PriA [Marinigracilibium pacificum]|uniref:Replication restart protein PriA n=1 Tax=Marinigracilibium pacificum TaxID=2729599 RepID=A0A848J7W5_9BACT|nr:primosomal protein N' [Marinigracilibium pacificum]NMM50580.1 primosomal protein N' [Marinigracilibium pacificum]